MISSVERICILVLIAIFILVCISTNLEILGASNTPSTPKLVATWVMQVAEENKSAFAHIWRPWSLKKLGKSILELASQLVLPRESKNISYFILGPASGYCPTYFSLIGLHLVWEEVCLLTEQKYTMTIKEHKVEVKVDVLQTLPFVWWAMASWCNRVRSAVLFLAIK